MCALRISTFQIKAVCTALWTLPEAPCEWLVTKFTKFWRATTKVTIALSVLFFFQHSLHGFYSECLGDIIVAGGGAYVLRLMSQTGTCHTRLHRVVLIWCVLIFVLRMGFFISAPDLTYRHRSMALLATFWRAALPVYSLRTKYTWLSMAALTIVEIATTAFSMWVWSETGILRVCSTLFLLSVAAASWCYAVPAFLHTIYHGQRQIAVEQEACQSILSMVCDATFWLAIDGDTILHGNPHLDAFLGTTTQGTTFSTYLSANEQERFRSTIGSSSQHVNLLPTTLQNVASGARITVDLFIVNRQRMFAALQDASDSASAYGFFVGLRFSAGMEPSVTSASPLLEAVSSALEPNAAIASDQNAATSSKPGKVYSESSRSTSSDISRWSVVDLPTIDTIKVEIDPVRGLLVTSVSLDFAASKPTTFEQWLVQPSFDSFHAWISDQVNSACHRKAMPSPQLGSILVSLPPLLAGRKGSVISASRAYLEEVDYEDLDAEEYPIVTLVLEGVQEIVKGLRSSRHRDIDAMPAICEIRHRSKGTSKNKHQFS